MAAISPKSESVSTTIRSYKSAVTKQTHRLGYPFEWQPRFHDHIIRDEAVICRDVACNVSYNINTQTCQSTKKQESNRNFLQYQTLA